MNSEAQELCVEGRQVSHSWCMCVIGHINPELDTSRNGGGGLYTCGTKLGGWSYVGRCQRLLECGDRLMTLPSRCIVLGRVESELYGLLGKA